MCCGLMIPALTVQVSWSECPVCVHTYSCVWPACVPKSPRVRERVKPLRKPTLRRRNPPSPPSIPHLELSCSGLWNERLHLVSKKVGYLEDAPGLPSEWETCTSQPPRSAKELELQGGLVCSKVTALIYCRADLRLLTMVPSQKGSGHFSARCTAGLVTPPLQSLSFPLLWL